jgi:hypothetical protein
MEKRERELRKAVLLECERLGCNMVCFERTGGSHYRIRAEGNDRTALVIASFSPRSKRHLDNMRAELRRQLTGDKHENQ